MGLAIVGDVSCSRGRIKHDIRLLDDKRLGARYGVIAARPVDDVDRSGITGVCVVFVADIVFAYINSCTAVFDHGLGLFRCAIIDAADKIGSISVFQLYDQVRHRLGGDGDNHRAHIGIAVVGVALYLIIYCVSSGIGLGGDV